MRERTLPGSVRSLFLCEVRKMRKCVAVLALLCCSPATWAVSLSLPASVDVESGEYVEVPAKTDGKSLRWLPMDRGLSLFPMSRLKDESAAVVRAKEPGTYRLACVAAGADGTMSLPAVCEVRVKGEKKEDTPKRDTRGPGRSDAVAATVRLVVGNGHCTATIVGPKRPDGRWDVLSAAHCAAAVGTAGVITLKDGRTFTVTVAAMSRARDICWLVTDRVSGDLPFATIAVGAVPRGLKVFHVGYGEDKPANREDGHVASEVGNDGFFWAMLSVSRGDSGAGVFNAATGEIVGVVHGTSAMGRYGLMRSACASCAVSIRPAMGSGVDPVAMPLYQIVDESSAPSPTPSPTPSL